MLDGNSRATKEGAVMTNDLVKRLRDLGEMVSVGHVVPPAGTYMLKAADRIEAQEAALREKDNIDYIIDSHGITHNTFTIVYKEKINDL
jgi:hypothetical protein